MKLRTLRRRRTALSAAGILAATGALIVAPTLAWANVSPSTFESNDGNLIVDSTKDWANMAEVATGIDVLDKKNDNAFGQGTKENTVSPTIVKGSIPPNKNDLTRFYEADEQVIPAGGGAPHTFLYLAWERAVNIGSANMDFEISQNPTPGFTSASTGTITLTRTVGDLLIGYNFSGSGTPTLTKQTWTGSAWGPVVNLSAAGVADGAVNAGTVSDPLQTPSGSLTAGLFGEAAIDLTAAGVFPPGVCESFGSVFVKSATSGSTQQDELKDFIAPAPVSISNCAGITIRKATQNGDSTFDYSSTGGLSPSTFQLANGGSKSFSSLNPGNYSVTEAISAAQATAGWSLVSITCTLTGSGTSASSSILTGQLDITLGNGGNADCTYTNHKTNSPSIATTLSDEAINVGDTIHDSSVLTGASATAGGTVTYTVYTDTACSLGATSAGTKTVTNGVVPDSDPITFNTAGDYYWQAVYSEDADNNGATSTCTSEHLVVSKRSPTIATTLSDESISVGDTIHDSSVLTGASATAGGTVTYTVYTDTACSLGATSAGTKTVTNGVVPDSDPITFNTAGDYYWQAVYSGDSANDGATSTCTSEHLVVAKKSPSASTAQNLLPNDSFTLSGGFSPTGSITFNLYSPSDATCSGSPAFTQTVSVSGNGTYATTNTSFLAAAQGTWRWASSYTGDANNNAATSACGVEAFTIDNDTTN